MVFRFLLFLPNFLKESMEWAGSYREPSSVIKVSDAVQRWVDQNCEARVDS